MAATSPCRKSAYDIIIAGGGTAGCVLATRLSEVPGLSILLLEAGGDHNDDIRVKIPALFSQALSDPDLDWNYYTAPQPELNGRRISLPRGKGLGGSSLINLLALVHPSKADYDGWSEMGNPGWDFDSMLPYLKKFQTFHMPSAQVSEALNLQYIDPRAQGIDGPIQASYQHETHPLDKAWVDTFRTLGCEMKADTMSGRSLGGYQITSSIDPEKRERSHAGNAYLDRARARHNLEIVTNVIVDKVVMTEGSPPRVSGIEFWHSGQRCMVSASREVILCAGVFGSPCILQRSGIGERKHLDGLEIDVVVENEQVGRNLQDHFMTGVSYELKEGVKTMDDFRDPAYVGAAMKQYQEDRTGPMVSACASFAYMPLVEQNRKGNASELSSLIKTHLATSSSKSREGLIRHMLENESEASANMCLLFCQTHLESDHIRDTFSFTDPGNYITFLTALAHPLSRGNVCCTSSVADAPPYIDPGYYSHPLDAELMSRHVQVFDQVADTEPLRSMLKPGGRRIPEWTELGCIEQNKKLLKQSCMSNAHPCGSCAMLPRDEGGVVDYQLNVYGISGLRVCDASIMPIIPRGNIISSVYAVAEKGADIIKHALDKHGSNLV